jgi:hypothetical protein
MRCVDYAVLVLLFFVGSSSAFDLHYEQENSRGGCVGGYDVGVALDNSTLYEQVFQWMHKKDVVDWNYSTEVRFNGTTDLQCVVISYKTMVEAPTFFARLLSNFRLELQFPIEVHKEVCLAEQTVLESASITAPLVQEFRMSGRYEVHDDHLKSSVEAHYDMPWYIDFLIHDVSEHLRTNFKRKVDAVAASMCMHRPGAALLSRAAQSYALGTLRRQPRKYPMPAPAEHRLHLPVEPPIHSPFGQRYY